MKNKGNSDKGYAQEEGRGATGNRLLLFPLPGLRFSFSYLNDRMPGQMLLDVILIL